MDLPDLVFDAERKNVLAVIVGSFTAVMPQRSVGVAICGSYRVLILQCVQVEDLGVAVCGACYLYPRHHTKRERREGE